MEPLPAASGPGSSGKRTPGRPSRAAGRRRCGARRGRGTAAGPARGPGLAAKEEVGQGQGWGLSKFRGTFPLEILRPCSAPYRRRPPGRAGAPRDPRLPAAARPGRPGALAPALAFFFFFFFPSPGCFSDTSFLRIGKKKKKKGEREPPPAVERARPPEAVAANFSLPPRLRARLKLRLCWGANLPAARLHSNVRAKAPGDRVGPGATLLRLRPTRSCASPGPGPVWERESGRPGSAPGRGRSAPAPWGRGAGSSRARNVASKPCERRRGALARDGQEEGRGDARTRDHSTETARG